MSPEEHKPLPTETQGAAEHTPEGQKPEVDHESENRFETAKVFIPNINLSRGTSVFDMKDFVEQTFGGQYEIPGTDYYEWLRANPDKVPQELKGPDHYYFFGGAYWDRHNDWRVPGGRWSSRGSANNRDLSEGSLAEYEGSPTHVWNSYYDKVVLLERKA